VIWGGALAIGWIAGADGALPGLGTPHEFGHWLALAGALALIHYGGRYLRQGLSEKGTTDDGVPARQVNPRSLPPPRR
jgi:hypothetical protein